MIGLRIKTQDPRAVKVLKVHSDRTIDASGYPPSLGQAVDYRHLEDGTGILGAGDACVNGCYPAVILSGGDV